MVPKAELHVHLEGTAPPDLVRRIAQRNGLEIPEGVFAAPDRFAWRDFLDFLNTYNLVLQRHPHRRGLPRHRLRVPGLVRAGRRDLRRADRVGRPLADRRPRRRRALGGHRRRRSTTRGATTASSRASSAWPCATSASSGAIEIAELPPRGRTPTSSASRWPATRPATRPSPIAEAYRIAADAGLGCTVHAGEWAGADSVRGALELPVTRIAHGVRAIEDPDAGRRARAPADHARGVPDEQRRPRGLPDLRGAPVPRPARGRDPAHARLRRPAVLRRQRRRANTRSPMSTSV